MCGLVAMVMLGGAQPDKHALDRMADALRHRGPDDSGSEFLGTVGLAFRRLSILDVSNQAHQPMTALDAPVRIIFNGEIYNYIELRNELITLGHSFRSSGDTEVLLRAYLQWGRACVERLNGMWAFVIDDQRSQSLFGSRDRFGIKPLFRVATPLAWVCASEIKALLTSGLIEAREHGPAVADFLADSRIDNDDHSFYEGIVQVPAAHCFEVDRRGHYRQWRYWSLELGTQQLSNPAETFAELFEDAVKLHMRSDVPVAVHLSGGLDSTAILCAADRVRQAAGAVDPMLAFCYQDAAYDETEFIDATLAQTGSSKVGLARTPRQLWDDMPRVLDAQDEPFHSMVAVVSYELMRLTAARGVKVVLNGQGADESLAGYGSYFANAWHSQLMDGQWGSLWYSLNVRSAVAGSGALRLGLGVLRRAAKHALNMNPIYRQASLRRWQRANEANTWIAPEIRSLVRRPQYPQPDLNSALASSMAVDPLPLYLRIEDRNSSAHSIESRVPFLDHRLVSFAFTLPTTWRMRGNLNKVVLREGSKGRIPEVVRTRVDKMGFPVGLRQWMRAQLQGTVRDMLTDPAFSRMGGVNAPRLVQMLDEHQRGIVDHSPSIFRAIQLFYWRELVKQRTARNHKPF
jgi:asparagine synthase (glutamine-hydrolysing)